MKDNLAKEFKKRKTCNRIVVTMKACICRENKAQSLMLKYLKSERFYLKL